MAKALLRLTIRTLRSTGCPIEFCCRPTGHGVTIGRALRRERIRDRRARQRGYAKWKGLGLAAGHAPARQVVTHLALDPHVASSLRFHGSNQHMVQELLTC